MRIGNKNPRPKNLYIVLREKPEEKVIDGEKENLLYPCTPNRISDGFHNICHVISFSSQTKKNSSNQTLKLTIKINNNKIK